MAKVNVDTKKLNARPVIPSGLYIAEILNCEFPFQAPWDGENFGINFEFQVTEDGPHKGRRLSLFCTTTEGKPFSGRYSQVVTSLGYTPGTEWDTDEVVGRTIGIRINQYTNKDGDLKNGVEEVLPTSG